MEHLLERAARGQGGVLGFTGPAGSGRSELALASAREGAFRGFEVLRAAAVRGTSGPVVWAQLLRDAGAPEDLASRLLSGAGPLELDSVASALASGNLRLLVIDDIDHGGAESLRAVAARAAARGTTAAACTTCGPCWPPQAARSRRSTWPRAAPDWSPRIPRRCWTRPAGRPTGGGSGRSTANSRPPTAPGTAQPPNEPAPSARRSLLSSAGQRGWPGTRAGPPPPTSGRARVNVTREPPSTASRWPPRSPGRICSLRSVPARCAGTSQHQEVQQPGAPD